jgi:pimeloyl-ACP methyl ester carboxylesterase
METVLRVLIIFAAVGIGVWLTSLVVEAEREHDRALIPNVQMTTVEKGGHFLPLDRPRHLSEAIIQFAQP